MSTTIKLEARWTAHLLLQNSTIWIQVFVTQWTSGLESRRGSCTKKSTTSKGHIERADFRSTIGNTSKKHKANQRFFIVSNRLYIGERGANSQNLHHANCEWRCRRSVSERSWTCTSTPSWWRILQRFILGTTVWRNVATLIDGIQGAPTVTQTWIGNRMFRACCTCSRSDQHRQVHQLKKRCTREAGSDSSPERVQPFAVRVRGVAT